MPKAYSYIRFSSPEQSRGDSERRQTELSENYALKHGLELDTTLNLKDLGISAYDRSNITKGALGEFLKLIEEGKIHSGSYLLVESLDRISRAQILDALSVFTSIINAGITIVTLKDNCTYSKQAINDNWSNLIMSLAIMNRATEESAMKSFRGRSSWDNKRTNIKSRRLTARCPYWLRPSSALSGFDVIPERVETVKKIFQMAKDGMGNHTITLRLNQENVPVFSKNANGWQPSYVQKVLRSKAVYGEFTMCTQRDGKIEQVSEPIENYYPTIIPKNEWLLINSLREERTTNGGVRKGKYISNLFSGLLKCGYCGSTMTMGGYSKSLKTGKGKSKKIVACSKARRGLGCHYSSWNYKQLETEILEYCHSIDFADALGKGTVLTTEAESARMETINLKAEIANTEKNIQSQVMAIESLEDTNPPTAILKRILDLEAKHTDLKIKYEAAERKSTLIDSQLMSQSSQHDAIIETIEKLKVLDGTELHNLRIRLTSQIKHVLDKIVLYPSGSYLTDENRTNLTNQLIAVGYDESRIAKHFRDLMLTANKEHRFITMVFHDKSFLRLTPSTIMSQNFIEYDKSRHNWEFE